MNTQELNKLLENKELSPESKKKLESLYEKINGKEFSDILDKNGNQYVYFVQEGGGVWGTALVGYLFALESFGIRFLRIAGTSAGAINTMLIAALGNHSENKSETIKKILFDWDFSEFIDGKSIVKRLANRILKSKTYIRRTLFLIGVLLFSLIFFPFLNLFLHLSSWFYFIPFTILCCIAGFIWYYNKLFKENNIGLNPGNAFEKKLQMELESFGIKSVKELQKAYVKKGRELNLDYRKGNGEEFYNIAIEKINEIYLEKKEGIDENRYKNFINNVKDNHLHRENPFLLLKADYTLITTDINAKIKVELPKMSEMYWTSQELSKISPATFVRASMSVPYFFEPLVKKINRSENSIVDAWKFWLNKEPKNISNEGIFIDGGSISNFPIDIFHTSDIFYPRVPVFGVRLTDDEEEKSELGLGKTQILKSALSLLMNIFNTLRGYNDNTFLNKHTFYSKHSIQTINCSPSHWLNFLMKEDEKLDLFNKGFRAGLDFLEKFNWEKYKYERVLIALKEKKILREETNKDVG